MVDEKLLKSIIEAALFTADSPLTIDHFLELFVEAEQPERKIIRAILQKLEKDYAERGIELVQVASGYRFQTKSDLTPWLKRLLQPERSPRYSRALLETMAIIAYRQPITRSEIEKIRGISVSTDIIKRLQDYNWIRILAHRESPGRPALYGTTRAFLDYFNLKNLSDLPTLTELREMELPTDIFEPVSDNNQTDAAVEEILSEKPNLIESGSIVEETPSEKPNLTAIAEEFPSEKPNLTESSSTDYQIHKTPEEEEKNAYHTIEKELDYGSQEAKNDIEKLDFKDDTQMNLFNKAPDSEKQ